MNKIAVIGASGFIGGHLVRALSARPFNVIGLSRTIPKEAGGARHLPVDMTDRESLKRALDGIDTVFHLGAAIPNAFARDPESVREGNRRGAESIVAACRAARVRTLVYVTGHLGPPPGGAARDLAFLDGKVAAESIILAAHDAQTLATTSIRAPVIFGPGDKITTSFIQGKAPAFPRFHCTFGFLHVADLIPLLIRAGERLEAREAGIGGEPIVIEGARMTFEDFFARPAWGRKPPIMLPYPMVRVFAGMNARMARLFRVAPMGAEMCPEVLDSMALHHRKEGGRPAVEALGLPAETERSVEEAIRGLVATGG